MAFDNTITLTDGAAATHDFVLTSRVGMSSVYVEDDSSATTRRELLIRHQKSGKQLGANILLQPWRRNVQLVVKKYDSTNARTEQFALNFTITGTTGNVISMTDAQNLRAMITNLLDEDFMTRVMVGES